MHSIVAYRNPFDQWIWESGSIYLVIALFLFCLAMEARKALK